jgi:hypothetical protein
MAQETSLDRILHLERQILRAICCEPGRSRKMRDAAIKELRAYRWQGAENRIVYDAVTKILKSGDVSAAEQLPAQATRMGFPDVNWELYLQTGERAETDVLGLLRELKAVENEALL